MQKVRRLHGVFCFQNSKYEFFSVPTERVVIATSNDLRGLGICHQQAFSRNSGNGISAKYAILRKIALLACYTVIQTRHIYQTDILRYSFVSDIIYSEVWTMELRVLNYFLAIAREENFTKAAAQLHVTQPTFCLLYTSDAADE